MKKLLVLEFNELCPDLLERFMKKGLLPNFMKLKAESVLKETITDAVESELNPWVQWVDVHTGKERSEHGILRLNEISRYKGDFTWDILSRRLGIKNWICGSMNASYSPDFLGRFLPDPWTKDVATFPNNELETYYDFVSQAVQGHSSKARVSPFAFLRSIVKHGVSFRTISLLISQLVSEKISRNSSWKRAMVLDWIQFDIFAKYYLKENPSYSTFFSNAVAHYQHHYWRDYEPEIFGLSKENVDKDKANAIILAYKNTDKLLGRLIKVVGRDTSLIFVTPLSQQPYTKNERFYYHIKSEKDFFETFDIPKGVRYRAVMAEQFQLHALNEEQAREIVENLNFYQMESNDYFHVGSNSLFLTNRQDNIVYVQCRCTKNVDNEAVFVDRTNQRRSFYNHFYKMDEVKAGCHSPRGIYWLRTDGNLMYPDSNPVSPNQVHKDILNFFGIKEVSQN